MLSATKRSALHPTGARVHFDPESHTYLVNDEALTSVTTVIKKWFPQFDSAAVAQKKAEREGLNVADLLGAWERKRDRAAAFGSKIHLLAETLIAGAGDHSAAEALAIEARETAYLNSLKKTLTRIGKFYDFVEVEKIVFSPTKKVAGTIDLLLRNKETGAYTVADWKTSREIKNKSYNNEMGSGLFSSLPNCNHIHYSLQLYAYRELLLREGYLPAETQVNGILIHLKDGSPEVVCDFIKPQILHNEIRALFESI